MKLRELLSRKVVTAGPEDPLKKGAQVLAESFTRVVPVFNGEGSMVGLFTADGVFFRLEN